MVEPLDKAIGLGVIGSGSNRFDLEEAVDLLHQLRGKIRSLVGQNFFRDSDPGKELLGNSTGLNGA